MTTGRGALETLGVGADAEHVYRDLLKTPGASTTDIHQRTALSQRRIRRALDELERRAMIARRSGVPARFQPAPPDIVVEALISAREDELSQARLDALQLTTSLYTPPEQPQVADLIEILSTREAVAERWLQMQRVTRERIEVFVRPPYAQERVEDDEAVQRLLHERSVMTFAIYDEGALRSPGALDHIRQMMGLGEQTRVVSQLPLKLALFDRRVALVPVSHSDPESTVDAGLLVHKSALLDALIALFDIYWQRGADVRLDHDETTAEAISSRRGQRADPARRRSQGRDHRPPTRRLDAHGPPTDCRPPRPARRDDPLPGRPCTWQARLARLGPESVGS